MSCINPIERQVKTKYFGVQTIKIECRHCMNCLTKRQSQIYFLASRELNTVYRTGRSASFVTLTYDDEHLPYNEEGFLTLRRSDVQKFVKNMRRQMEYHNKRFPFKYMYCGEYGDGSRSSDGTTTHRPHYHLVFFGLSPDCVRKYTRKLWKHGLCDIGPLSQGGIRYLTKYMTKCVPDKATKVIREVANVQNPFFYHSIGIGKSWILENMRKIVENGFTFSIAGKKELFPAFVLRFVSAHTGVNYIPFVQKFLNDSLVREAHVKGVSPLTLDFEKSYIREKQMIASLRSKNMPVNDITLSKYYIRPAHYVDRRDYSALNKLVDKAYANCHI